MRLAEILRDLETKVQTEGAHGVEGSLRQAAEGWLAERQSEKGLKRSTVLSTGRTCWESRMVAEARSCSRCYSRPAGLVPIAGGSGLDE